MKYFGGKGLLSSALEGYILRYVDDCYVEPFVGGASMMCKVVPPVWGKQFRRIGYDKNHALIVMWKALGNGWEPPDVITKKMYYELKERMDLDDPLTAFAGFFCAFQGLWFNSYAISGGERNSDWEYDKKKTIHKVRQKMSMLKGVDWVCSDYRDIEVPRGTVVYCDPPYRGIDGYPAVEQFDSDEFWDWCREKTIEGNVVLISEYEAPDDFECVAEIPTKVSILKGGNSNPRVEKLFRWPCG